LQLADFEIGLVLGRGGYGKIYLARTRRGRFLCALKLVSVAKLEAKEMEAQMLQEIRIQSAAQHEHVLLQYAHFASTSHIYLVLEHAPGGDLHTRLLARGGRGLAHASAALVTRQLSAAVAYCHAMHIIHRDIKAENILFDLAGRVKLGDFGWAVQSSRRRQTYCGTLEYLAPEMVACYRAAAGRSTYDAAVDAWSVGVVLFEMLTGTTPFEVAATPWADATDERRRLRAEVHGRITAATVAFPSARAPSEAARGLALQLLEKDAARRCKVGDVHAHPWIV
ncbi:serine/threonine-protein kinase aurora-3, partial [Pelagophyceae sp. CCMP2097]